MAGYEPLKAPRFRRETVPGGYEFVIPARKNWFAIPFLCFWLTAWTLGGIAAIYAALSGGEVFIYIWLIGWAFGWYFAATQLLFMLTGLEYIQSSGGDIEVGYRGFLVGRRRRFRGSEVSGLAACDGLNNLFGSNWSGWSFPIFRYHPTGTVRFNHGARTIYAGNGLDRAEAELIVANLIRSLPNAS